MHMTHSQITEQKNFIMDYRQTPKIIYDFSKEQ